MPSRGRWTLAAGILGSSVAFVDATVVNVALRALQADRHAMIVAATLALAATVVGSAIR